MMTLDPAALYLAALVNGSDDAISSENTQGIIETWNPAAVRMFGYTEAEIIGSSSDVLVPVERIEQERAAMARVYRGEALAHFETVRLHREGRRVPVSLTISPIRTPAGDVIGVSKIARDITQQKELEREYFRLAAIVTSSEDAIVSKNLDGIILTWNNAAERMFGYSAAEAVGRSIRLIIPSDRQQEEDEVLARVRSGRAVEHFETVRRRKDGTFLDISLTVSPIRGRDGTIIGASKIARDITAQRRVMRELEEVSRLKDEFLATLSHELRTPLNAVLGYVQMLRSPQVPDARRHHMIEIIERNAQVLAQLVADVLDTSSIVTGKVQLSMQPCDLVAIIQSAIEVVRPSADAKQLQLTFRTEGDHVLVSCDKDRMRQVFWNLLSNAVKFTSEGGRIDVVLSKRPHSVEITVADTGIGISPEFLPHVFQRFWQAEGGFTRHFGGLGLGLALVRHFVELHGGRVTATSKGEGQGAAFHVSLPVRA